MEFNKILPRLVKPHFFPQESQFPAEVIGLRTFALFHPGQSRSATGTGLLLRNRLPVNLPVI
jgi:hypothetical protein